MTSSKSELRNRNHDEFKSLRYSALHSNPDFHDPKYISNRIQQAEGYRTQAKRDENEKDGFLSRAGYACIHAAYASIVINDIRAAAHCYKQAVKSFKERTSDPFSHFDINDANFYYSVLKQEAAKRVLCNRRLRKLSFGLLGKVDKKVEGSVK